MELTHEIIRQSATELSKPKTFGHFIGGEWVEGNCGETIALENPATRQVIGHIQSGNAKDVDRAVEAAAAAFSSWSTSHPMQRQNILRALAQRIRDRQFEYAMLESLNNGKPITDAFTHDIVGAAGHFDFFSGAAFYPHGQTADFVDGTMLVHRQPIGVVAQITPWNVPLLMAAFKLAPALVAGCTVVLKPAEVACLSVMQFMQDVADIVPPGVINVVTGYGPTIGEPLVTHPKVRKVTFTGSRPTAQKIIEYAAKNIIPQTMELGGKNANIVCEDANIDAAAQSAVIANIFNKGEVCTAATRVLVHEGIKEEFLESFKRQLQAVRQGDPLDPETQLGAMASKRQFDKVSGYLNLAREEGAKVAQGGKAARIENLEEGLFIEPTIFTDVRSNMRISQEEIFGPVATITTWTDENDMLRQANDTVYGLACGIWTRNLNRAHRIARSMDVGMIWVNRYYNFKPGMPLGGFKQSGFGREGCLETLQHYTQAKGVILNLDEPQSNYAVRAPAPNSED